MAGLPEMFTCCVGLSPTHREVECVDVMQHSAGAVATSVAVEWRADTVMIVSATYADRDSFSGLDCHKYSVDQRPVREIVLNEGLRYFCCGAEGAQVHPTRAELEAVAEKCAGEDPASLSATLVDQLSWAASGDMAWQPRLRALHALLHFGAQSKGNLRVAAVSALDDCAEVLKHMTVAVPECRCLALDALMMSEDLELERNAQEDEHSIMVGRAQQPCAAAAKGTAKLGQCAVTGSAETARLRPESFFLMRRWQGPLLTVLRQRQWEQPGRVLEQELQTKQHQEHEHRHQQQQHWQKLSQPSVDAMEQMVELSTSTDGSEDAYFERFPIPSAHIGDDDNLRAVDLL